MDLLTYFTILILILTFKWDMPTRCFIISKEVIIITFFTGVFSLKLVNYYLITSRYLQFWIFWEATWQELLTTKYPLEQVSHWKGNSVEDIKQLTISITTQFLKLVTGSIFNPCFNGQVLQELWSSYSRQLTALISWHSLFKRM